MRKIYLLLGCLLSVLTLASCSPMDDDYIAAQVIGLQKAIADNLPKGSTLESAQTFFEKQGIRTRYENNGNVLYAPKNIEPKPRSWLPFEFGLIKSYDIRCSFTEEQKLTRCTVVPSTTRWD